MKKIKRFFRDKWYRFLLIERYRVKAVDGSCESLFLYTYLDAAQLLKSEFEEIMRKEFYVYDVKLKEVSDAQNANGKGA